MTDRELDALVAEKVMGLDPQDHQRWGVSDNGGGSAYASTSPDGPWHTKESLEVWLRDCKDRDYLTDCEVVPFYVAWPHYSTSIEAAWEVAVRFWPYIKLDGRGIDENNDMGWECRIWTGHGAEMEGSVSAIDKRAPRAICLAALKAVGAEVPA
jgi:hypothetical protein